MTKIIFSPDVLAANPDLAAKLKSSKAKTPSGRGNGFTDDAQDYPREIPDYAAEMRKAAQQAGWLITWHAERAGVLNDKRVQAALAALGEVRGMR